MKIAYQLKMKHNTRHDQLFWTNFVVFATLFLFSFFKQSSMFLCHCDSLCFHPMQIHRLNPLTLTQMNASRLESIRNSKGSTN